MRTKRKSVKTLRCEKKAKQNQITSQGMQDAVNILDTETGQTADENIVTIIAGIQPPQNVFIREEPSCSGFLTPLEKRRKTKAASNRKRYRNDQNYRENVKAKTRLTYAHNDLREKERSFKRRKYASDVDYSSGKKASKRQNYFSNAIYREKAREYIKIRYAENLAYKIKVQEQSKR